MRKTLIAAALLAVANTSGAFAHDVSWQAQPHAHPTYRAHSHSGPTIKQQVRIVCFRGPTSETIWDKPRAVFIDDLVTLGYDFSEASAIANLICTDATAVGQPELLKERLLAAIAQNPPGH